MDPHQPFGAFQGYGEYSSEQLPHGLDGVGDGGAPGAYAPGSYSGAAPATERGRVFAGNLPWSWNSGRLQQAFSSLGPIYDAEVSRGCGEAAGT